MGITVTGLREVEKVLLELGSKSGTAVLRKSMLKALDPASDQAKASVPVASGSLRQSITRRFLIGSSSKAATTLPALGGRFRAQLYPAFKAKRAIAKYESYYGRKIKGVRHGHLVEFGFTTRNGRKIAGRPFLGPALESRAGQVVQRFADYMRISIEKEIIKRFAKR